MRLTRLFGRKGEIRRYLVHTRTQEEVQQGRFWSSARFGPKVLEMIAYTVKRESLFQQQ